MTLVLAYQGINEVVLATDLFTLRSSQHLLDPSSKDEGFSDFMKEKLKKTSTHYYVCAGLVTVPINVILNLASLEDLISGKEPSPNGLIRNYRNIFPRLDYGKCDFTILDHKQPQLYHRRFSKRRLFKGREPVLKIPENTRYAFAVLGHGQSLYEIVHNAFIGKRAEEIADEFQQILLDIAEKVPQIQGFVTYIARNGEVIIHSQSI